MKLIKRMRFPLREILLVGILPSFLKKSIYRLRGYKIGKGVTMGIGSVVVGKQVEIGEYTQIGFLSIIKGRHIRIGRMVEIGSTSVIDTERIEIDDEAVITEQVFIGGNPTPDSHFKLGKRSIVMYMSYLNSSKKLFIGDDTGIGGHCIIFTHGSWQSELDGYPVKYEDIIIGNNVWLPWRIFVMPGVTIGDNTTIGANSLVNKSLPEGVLAAGNPIKILKTKDEYPKKLTPEEKSQIVENILQEYTRELEYHNVEVTTEKNTDYWLLNIKSRSERQTFVYLIQDCPFFQQLKFSPTVSVLTLLPLTAAQKTKISANGAMLMDLHARERSGSTKAGEEMILILKKRGISLIRKEYHT